MSLRLKTILGVALIEAVLLIILVLTLVDFIKGSNYEALSKRASTTATLFATTTKNAVLSFDLASVQSFVNEVMKNPDLTYARVVSPDGLLFAEAGNRDHLKDGVFKPDHNFELLDDDVYDASADIAEGGVVYGRVELGIDVGSINRAISEVTRWSMVLASAEMLLVALFSFILGGYLTGQLKTLRFAARQVSQGHLNIQLTEKGNDEVTDVCKAFNHMADSLKQTSKERDQYESSLLELNKTLESRVDARTSELMQKNSELESAYRSLKETQSKLIHAEKMASVGVLASGVAHEINNPVSFTMSNLYTLKDYLNTYNQVIEDYQRLSTIDDFSNYTQQVEELNSRLITSDFSFIQQDVGELVQEAIQGTERIRDIVANLQDFSSPDKMKISDHVDINTLLSSSITLVNNELTDKIKLNTRLQTLPNVRCVKQQMTQVFMNILRNAIQSIETEGCIEVSSQPGQNETIEVTIRDNGKGIAPSEITKVFDPFYTTKPVGEGVGLGLSTAYGIVSDLHGEIKISSELGEGTVVKVILPAATTEQD